MCRDKKQSGAEKTPTETPTETSTDGTKCRAEVAKPRLKTGRCLGKPRSVFWTTGRGLKNAEAAFCKTPNVKMEQENTESVFRKNPGRWF